ncbi:MAG: LysM peptidoglycan-binding domain-containing protein [Proteobacteria bacterium]|nr:LysM peptidoglycan-binding domain-containing protein [Pseudomonadota bacterium]
MILRNFLIGSLMTLSLASLMPHLVYAESPAQDTHTVQKGDTLWSIARAYYGDPKQYTLLLEYNPGITETHEMRPGEIIYLAPRNPAKPEQAKLPPVKVRPRPFSWSKEFHKDTFQYEVTIKDADGEVIYTHYVPPVDNNYRDRRVNKKPGERMTLTELHDREHPWSDCDFSFDSLFVEQELYRLIRQDDPVIAKQLDSIGSVTFTDMNFDGYDDLVIEKSIFGIIKTHFTDILFWDEAKQTFVTSSSPHLISAGNVVLNKEDKTIKFAKQLCMEDWAYFVYRMDEENHWQFVEAVREDCSRNLTIGTLVMMREEELDQHQFSCKYQIYHNADISKSQNADATTYSHAQLTPAWQQYIKGDEHPNLLNDPNYMDYARLYIRNHTLKFNSVEEMEQWKKEHDVGPGPFGGLFK